MRTIEGSLLNEPKTVQNVSHYLSPHHATAEEVTDELSLDGSVVNNRSVNIMHPGNYGAHHTICRQDSGGGDGQLSSDGWGVELLGSEEGVANAADQLSDDDRRLAAALEAVQFVQQHNRHPIMHDLGQVIKIVSEKAGLSSNSFLENSIRLYHQQNVEQVELRESDLVEVQNLQSLPSLAPLKNGQDSVWYHIKTADQYPKGFKGIEEDTSAIEADDIEIEVHESSLIQNKQQQQQSKKSLPHKKRISKKLKKHIPHILQMSNSRGSVHDLDDDKLMQDTVTNEVLNRTEHGISSSQIDSASHVNRAMFICQLCGEYYGSNQIQFFHHLKEHYEPHSNSIIIESSIGNIQNDADAIEIDKMEGSMVVANAPLPEALVELSLEGTVSDKTSLYESSDKLPVYQTSDKNFFNEPKSSVYSSDKSENMFQQPQKQDNMYVNIEKLYSCTQCPKTFRRQRQYEIHSRDAHSKVDEMSEFSDPEDLMEGINVVVEPEAEDFLQDDVSQDSNTILIQSSDGTQEQYILPHLQIENGQVHQLHLNSKQWCIKQCLDDAENDGKNTLTIEETGNDNNSQTTIHELNQKSIEEVICPLCGGSLPSRDYLEHAQQCHMRLKEQVLKHKMEVEAANYADVDTDHMIEKEECEVEEVEETVETVSAKEPENTISKGAYSCAYCSRQFKHKNSMIYHLLSHNGNRPYECDVCQKAFFSTGALKVHRRLHSGDKPYKCEECGRLFRQWGDLKYHFTSIHSNLKQHQCEYCGKDFARKYSLIVHRRIHTGEKNYKCEFCDKTFRASSYLQNHRRIHTGEKPHACSVCGKRFRMKGDMRRHLSTHSKEKVKFTSDNEGDTVPEKEPPKRKTRSSAAVTAEMKVEKQEDASENGKDDSSDGNKAQNANMIQSSTNENILPDETRLPANFPLDANGAMYVWPVFIT